MLAGAPWLSEFLPPMLRHVHIKHVAFVPGPLFVGERSHVCTVALVSNMKPLPMYLDFPPGLILGRLADRKSVV